MTILFNEEDLVSFGNFILLSVANTSDDKLQDRLGGVTGEDLQTWYNEYDQQNESFEVIEDENRHYQ